MNRNDGDGAPPVPSLSAAQLEEFARSAGLGGASLVLERLGSGPEAPVEARTVVRPLKAIYPASMIKLPIAMVLADLCEAGAFAWTDQVTIAAANMTSNDAPSPFAPGYVAELRELAHAMLSASDNVATNVLVDVIGRQTITRACTALGLAGTIVARKLSGSLPLIDDPEATGRNAHPAADAATLFRLVARAAARGPTIVSRALEAQIWNDKLSRGLRDGDTFAHKTGDTDEVSHDGGILTLARGRRYVLVVYANLPSNTETDARFAAFMRALRPHLDA